MKDLLQPPFHQWRRHDAEVVVKYGDFGGSHEGAFFIPSGTSFGGYRANISLAVIASSGEGWDHVSVSCKNRTPNWAEMMLIQRIFFKEDEIALQFGVPKNDHVNVHPHVLHWWRPWKTEIELPPVNFV